MDKWKEKYLDLLDEQEQQEKDWDTRLALLTRVQSRLSLAAQGQDARLDENLKLLRKRLNDQASSGAIQQALSDLDETVLALDASRDQDREQAIEAFVKICRNLLRFKPPKELSHNITGLIDAVRKANTSIYGEQWQQVAEYQSAALDSPNNSDEKKGFFSKLFGGDDTPAIPEAKQVESSQPHDPDSLEQVASPEQPEPPEQPSLSLQGEPLDQPQRIGSSVDRSVAPSPSVEPSQDVSLQAEISRILHHLLEHLAVPDDMKELSDQLQAQLANPLDWGQLIPVLDDVSKLVIQAFGHDQKEFEVFLKTLDSRLKDMQSGLVGVRQTQADSGQANRELDASMRERFGMMRSDVDESVDLNDLKTNIRAHVEHIASRLDEFKEYQTQKEAEMEAQFELLNDKVALLEVESHQAKQRLEEQKRKSTTDTLTELPNREAYYTKLSEELSRFERYGRSAIFAVADIDYFKRINDTYGHLAGDNVLKVVAKVIRKRLRQADFVARYGGEEFVVILPETETTTADQALNTLREAVQQCPFHFNNEQLEVTLSFGFTAFQAGDDRDSLFGRADSALYKAKEQGRNRCVQG